MMRKIPKIGWEKSTPLALNNEGRYTGYEIPEDLKFKQARLA